MIGLEAQKQMEKEKKLHPATTGGPAAKLGDPVSFADSTWVVAAARDRGAKLGGAGSSATTAGTFVEVRFSVTNLTKKEDSLLDLPAVLDAQGREYKPFERSSAFLPAGAAQRRDGRRPVPAACAPPRGTGCARIPPC